MFTEGNSIPISSVLQQLKPQLHRFLHTKREHLNLLEHPILQLTGKIANRTPCIDNLPVPLILSLAWNVRCRDDLNSIRVYQKKREALPVPWFRTVL